MITTGMRANDRACHARQDVPGFIVITLVLLKKCVFAYQNSVILGTNKQFADVAKKLFLKGC